jgi:hypothetical protein
MNISLSYQGEVDISNKIAKYTKTLGVIDNVLKPSLAQRHAQLCLYRAPAQSILCSGSKVSTIKRQDINKELNQRQITFRIIRGNGTHKPNEYRRIPEQILCYQPRE